jgi:predicted aldo/keto reductase-like oxidoreductase
MCTKHMCFIVVVYTHQMQYSAVSDTYNKLKDKHWVKFVGFSAEHYNAIVIEILIREEVIRQVPWLDSPQFHLEKVNNYKLVYE